MMFISTLATRYSLLTTLRKGQVMILTVLALGGTMLGATTIAGLLMLYQLRQANDLSNSARAIFAADAGMEWAFYNLFCKGDPLKIPCPLAELQGSDFANGASVTVICEDEDGVAIPQCYPEESGKAIRRIRSIGKSNAANRAFEARF